MATEKSIAVRVTQQLGSLEISTRPMFGEFCVYHRGKVVGFICDNTLFVKITPAGAAFAGEIERGSPYPGAKPYFRITQAQLDDDEWLTALVDITTDALPEARRRVKRPRPSIERS